MPRATASASDPASRLHEYARKRAFDATPEPSPSLDADGDGPLLFVVQQHAARRNPWDLRLEMGGVLLSWALPEGPSMNAGDRRKAVRTEDHPRAYAAFEGVIPPGQYGAGPVIVWDAGVYSPDEGAHYAFEDRSAAERRTAEGLARGKLSVLLRGHKLKGSFALVRMKNAQEWLFIKHRDRFARAAPPVIAEDRSVLSNRSLAEVKRMPASAARMPVARLTVRGARGVMPNRISPMLATPADAPFASPDWLYEPKLDGYRALAFVRGADARLQSRRGGLDLNGPVPHIRVELASQAVEGMILDGELVAFDADGKPSFHALQSRVPGTQRSRARRPEAPPAECIYFCFDLLYFAGIDLRSCRYDDRRRYLEQCLLPSAHVQIVHAEADGAALHRAALESGFEGSVAKRRDSLYKAGERSAEWLKVKRVDTADYLIGGYTRGKGWRAAQFGALLLGELAADGRLRYVGRVGSGFDDRLLQTLKARFAALETAVMPFGERPQGLQNITWLEPQLSAEVRYAERTPQGLLRAPVFVRLREDKPGGPSRRRNFGRSAHTDEPRTRLRRGIAEAAVGAATDREISDVVEQLQQGKPKKMMLELGEHVIALTNLDKALWPQERALERAAYTKRDFLAYLAAIAPYILPHLADRPLTMIRMPDGIHGERFFQKHWDRPLPTFVETIEVFSESKRERQEYLLCNNVPTLLWLGQIGTLEFHVWHSRANTAPEADGAGTDYASSLDALESSILNYPDFVVFDLDPYIYSGKEAQGAEPELNDAAFMRTREVAFWLRDLMRSMALEPIVKTSGKTGLHVFLPIVRTIDFDAARAVCEVIGRHLLQQHPDDITMEWSTQKRTGKIFFDHNMNARAKTLNVAYSPRGVAGAAVSMPLSWETLETAHPLDFRMDNAAERLAREGDCWANVLSQKQDLTRSLELEAAAPSETQTKKFRRAGKRR